MEGMAGSGSAGTAGGSTAGTQVGSGGMMRIFLHVSIV